MGILGRPREWATGLAAAGTVGLVVGGLVIAGGSGAAEPRTLTLAYDCPFPLIGTRRVSVTINADIQSTIPVGQATPEFVIDSTANAGQNATQGLVLVGLGRHCEAPLWTARVGWVGR